MGMVEPLAETEVLKVVDPVELGAVMAVGKSVVYEEMVMAVGWERQVIEAMEGRLVALQTKRCNSGCQHTQVCLHHNRGSRAGTPCDSILHWTHRSLGMLQQRCKHPSMALQHEESQEGGQRAGEEVTPVAFAEADLVVAPEAG